MTASRPLRHARRRLAATVLAAATGLALLSACGGGGDDDKATTKAPDESTPWSTIEADAKTEGEVTVWSTIQGTANDELKKAFEKAYPDIKVTIAPFAPADITQKVDAEKTGGTVTADFLIQTDRVWHEKVQSAGYFAKVLGPDAEEADERLRGGAAPDTSGKTVTTQALYADNTLAVLGYSGLGFAWNKDKIKSEPSFDSMFADDTYKGHVGIVDPESSLGIQNAYAVWADRHPDLFKKLGGLNVTVYPTGQALAQGMSAGAVDIGFPSTLSVTTQMPNLGFAYDLPAPAQPRFGEVMASAPHPNAAQVFADWMMTNVAQETLVKVGGSLPVIPVEGGLAGGDVHVYDVAATPEVAATLAEIKADLGR